MRILLVSQNYLQPNNGQAVFTRRLAEGLAARGHYVVAATPSDREVPYTSLDGGVHLEAVRSRSLRPWYSDVFVTFRAGPDAERILEQHRPEIVHVQDHFPLCRAVVRRLSGQALVGTNHFLPGNIIPFIPVLGKLTLLRGWLERYMMRQVRPVFDRALLVTTPTETAARILRSYGIAPPIEAISCGVETDRFQPDPAVDRAAVRRRYGLDPAAALLLFVGRVDREKRLDVLLHALALLPDTPVQLAIVGRGRSREELRSLARDLGLLARPAPSAARAQSGAADDVSMPCPAAVFTDFVPAEDLPLLLNAADIFAMPSEAELQSIATLEAEAAGKPVLAADAQALPELVEEGVNGYLFGARDARDAARKITLLLQERARWPEMGAASRQRALRHDVRNTVLAYEALYARVLGTRMSGRLVNR